MPQLYPIDIRDALEKALALHRNGDLDAAKAICSDILRHEPTPVDALHLLGILEHETRHTDAAIRLIRRAIGMDPWHGSLYRTLGGIFKDIGKFREARNCFHQAVRIDDNDAVAHYHLGDLYFKVRQYKAAVVHLSRTVVLNPNAVEAHFKLGVIHNMMGRTDEAVHHYRQVLGIDEDIAEAHNNLGAIYKARGELRTAVDCFEKAVAVCPDFIEAHNNLADVHRKTGQWKRAVESLNNMLKFVPNAWEIHIRQGDLYREAAQNDEAMAQYEKAVALAPEQSVTHFKLGLCLAEAGEIAKAISSYQKAITLKPDAVEPHINLGNLYTKHNNPTDAAACYREAVRLKPNDPKPRYFLGCVYRDLGDLNASIRETKKALEIDPGYAEAHFSMALSLLLSGDLPAGWKVYDWRLKMEKYRNDYVYLNRRPLWNGENFKGKTLLVQSEQGFGDIIQFVRYLPLVKQMGGRVILDTYGPLYRLFQRISGADHLLVGDTSSIPDFDFYIPLMSLPGCLGTTMETIPASVPYLFAPEEKIGHWKSRIPGGGIKVGIVWAGNPSYEKDKARSCGLEYFEPISRQPGIRLFGLQKEISEADRALTAKLGIQNLGSYFDDFADTAAAIDQLDLVISVDTAVAHLAGAMGKPTWTLLSFSPDFRWLIGRIDTPWYPTMRLYRQENAMRWQPVFDAVGRDILIFRDEKQVPIHK